MKPFIAIMIVAVLAVSACSGDNRAAPGPIPKSCGLSTPAPSFDASKVPSGWLVEGSEAVGLTRSKDRFGLVINLPYTVGDTLSKYKAVVVELGFTVISVDNEIFEAEVFFESKQRVGSIQIRQSACEDASVALVTVVEQ